MSPVYLPKSLLADFDARKSTESLTPTLDALKASISQALSPPPAPLPSRTPDQMPAIQTPEASAMTAPVEAPQFTAPQLPSVDEIMSGGVSNGNAGAGVVQEGDGGVRPDVGGNSGTLGEIGSTPSIGAEGSGQDQGDTQPITFELPTVEQIMGRFAPEKPEAVSTMGAQPITGTESVPSGAAAPVQRGPVSGGGGAAVPLDMSSPDAYKRTLMSNAQQIASKYDLPASIIAAIPIQEAGYAGSELTKRANNLFSIKGTGPAGSEHFGSVWEVIGGKNVNVPADFRKYNSAAESFEDFAKLITETPRYAGAVDIWKKTRDPNAFIQAVQGAGYATDPTWAGKVASIASSMPAGSDMVPTVASNTNTGGRESVTAGSSIPPSGQSTSLDFQQLTKDWAGKPYVFGGAGGRGGGLAPTDCSGFVSEVFKENGVDLPAHTDAAYNTILKGTGRQVSESEARPGDVVFYMGAGTGGAITHHMGLYSGPGTVLDMSTAGGGGVKQRPIGHGGEYVILRDERMNPDSGPTPAPATLARGEPIAPSIVPAGVAEESGGVPPAQEQIDQWSMLSKGFQQNAQSFANAGQEDRIKGVPVSQAMRGGTTMGYEDMSGLRGEPAGGDASAPTSDGGYAPPTPAPPIRDIRGDYAPVTASVSAQEPSNAVEPAAPTPPAPASLGDQIKGVFSELGNRLGDLLGGKPDYQQAAQDIQQRQSTLPGTPQAEALAQEPMPLQPIADVAQGAANIWQGAKNIAASEGENAGRLARLNVKKVTQGLTPEETEEAKQLSISLSQYAVPGAPMELRGIAPEVRAGVEGRLPEQVAARRLETAPAAGIVSTDDAGRATDRYYHGTGSDFTRPEAGKFDPNGLFGPGYYLTDEPRVAGGAFNEAGIPVASGGYSLGKSSGPMDSYADAVMTVQKLERQLADPEIRAKWAAIKPQSQNGQAARTSNFLEHQEQNLERLKANIDMYQESATGANIRPVDVPRDLRLLDADAPIGDSVARRAQSFFGDTQTVYPQMHGEELYARLYEDFQNFRGDPKVEITRQLQEWGYDGIRYAGGKRIPMMDEAGQAIEHNAVVIFPESLDKITNATAGTRGGLLPSPGSPGAAVARGATQGGVAGGYEASQEEGAGPLDVVRGALVGGAEGAALGGARRAIGPRGAGTTIARAIPKTNADAWDAVTETIRADAPDPFPERVENWARKLPSDAVRNMFDATVPLRQATEAAQKAIGRKLQPDENAWLLARLLPGTSRRADFIARDSLGPAVKGLDDAGYERLNGYLAALDAVDKSKALGNPNRKFGSFTGVEAQQAVDHLRTTLPRNELADLDSRAAMVRDHVNAMRDRMTESGLISQDMADEFKQKYPNYSPIQFTDWMDQAERAQGSTASLSVSQNGVKRLTEHGASYGRQTPTEALLEATHDVERRAAKNEAAQAFINYSRVDPIAEQLTRPANEAAASYLGKPLAEKRRPNETTFTMWDNGVKHEFYIDKDLEGAFRQDQFQIPGIGGAAIRAASSAFRAGATGSNVLFLIPNAIGDALTATIRGESPASIARGYKQAFTRGPEYEAAMRAGVGYSGFVESGGAAKTMRELRGSLSTFDQLKEYASWANPLKVAQELGEKVEMAPRVGMYGQMIREGAAPQEAALAGRDVTMDFARAGLWSRAMNQLVPFFNVGMQAPAQVARFLSKAAPGELKPSQAEALARVSGMVVAPVVGLEVYNRTHDSYADVPQYDKDRGLIIMDPRGPGPENPDTGRPTPRYAIMALREWTPFAIATRAAMEGELGPEHWQELAVRMSQYSSPVSLSEGVQSIVPPWISVPIEMKANYDAFRQRPIVPDSLTDRLPEEQYTSTTSETSKLIGRALQKPPAMIEHAIRGFGTGVAGQALAASDTALRAMGAAPAREDTGLVKDLPVVGGLAGRFYREQGGELNARSRQENDAQFESIMRDAGLRGDEISRPGWKIGDTRLNAAEKAEYDELFNDYLDRELSVALNRSGDPAELARAAAAKARQAASARILQSISGPERSYRRQEERAKVAS